MSGTNGAEYQGSGELGLGNESFGAPIERGERQQRFAAAAAPMVVSRTMEQKAQAVQQTRDQLIARAYAMGEVID